MKTATNFGNTVRSFLATFAIVGLVVAPLAALPSSAFATEVQFTYNPEITICHALPEAASHSYNSISPNASSIVTGNGHGSDDNDIIPPFDYNPGTGTTTYGGKNWDTAGQATWNNHCIVPPPTPSTLKVHIYKYLKTASTTAQVPNDAGIQTFPMTATWSATNIGSGTGLYVLGDGHGFAAFTYAADTSAMSAPADYTTSEVTGGNSTVLAPGAACVDGKYRLVGYKAGDSLSAAQNAALTTTTPAYTGLTADKYVIVVNEKCAPVVPTTPKQCFVVSDATNLLGTTTATAALVTPNPAWTTALATGTAKWIWSSVTVLNPGQTETATFTKYFNVDVVPAGATLRIAADNSYTASLNGTPLSCDGSGILNFSSIDTCSAPVVAGINTLTFTATNAGVPGETNPAANPAGLTYELQIDGSSCSPVPPDACLNIDGLQTTVPGGYTADANHICTPVVVEAPFCRIGSNLLQNASFETPVVSTSSNGGKWQIFPIVANWAISNDGLELWNKFTGLGAGFASAGNQNAELDGNSPSTISQVIATVPGATYELRYDFSPRAGTNLADNYVAAQAGGVTISSTSADGSTNTGNVWTTHSKTFVATSTNTTITFKDLGTPDSLGTLIDNTGVCFVSAAPAPTCNLVEVSGTSTQVTETASTAKILSYLHPAWTAVINGASWIWGQNPVTLADTQVNATQHFTKTFIWHGAVGAATLSLAADNSYIVKLNGTQIGADAGEFNYNSTGQDIITGFTGQIQEGTNTLEVAVTNKGIVGSTQASNPAGLLYKLTVTGSDRSCTPTDGGGGNGGGSNPQLYHIFGNSWNDGNQSDVKDEGEPNLGGWTVSITNGGVTQSTTTDANGNYYFDVPAGTWTITEGAQAGWELNFPNTGSHVVTVPAVMTMAAPSSFLAYFVNVAEAAVVTQTFGPYNFGSHTVPPPTITTTTGGGGGGGGNSTGRSGGTNRLGILGGSGGTNGEVLGASTSNLPNGEVLGAVAPVGAPNTGEGGADTNTTANALTAFFVTLLGLALLVAPKRA